MQTSSFLLLSLLFILIVCYVEQSNAGKAELMQKFTDVSQKMSVYINKGKQGMNVIRSFIPCLAMVGNLISNLRKYGPQAKGMRLCVDHALQNVEDNQEKHDDHMTREDIQSRIKGCLNGFMAAARGKNQVEDDQLGEVKTCFLTAASSISEFMAKNNAGGGEEEEGEEEEEGSTSAPSKRK